MGESADGSPDWMILGYAIDPKTGRKKYSEAGVYYINQIAKLRKFEEGENPPEITELRAEETPKTGGGLRRFSLKKKREEELDNVI